jgi:hypothetical protein
VNAILEFLEDIWDDIVSLFSSKPVAGTIQPCPLAKVNIPAGCEYLNKGGTVEAPLSNFDRIRKPATIGAEREVQHQFPGDAAPVDAISQTVTVDRRTVEVVRPKAGVAPKELPSVGQIAKSLGAVPPKQLDKINTIELSDQPNPDDAYWAVQYNQPDFYSAATGGPGKVTFYPKDTPWEQEFCDSTAIHEGGHAYSADLWKDSKTKDEWEKMMAKDDRSPSTYADSASTEDFSESLVMYSLSKNTKCERAARKLFPNRYAALDELLQ